MNNIWLSTAAALLLSTSGATASPELPPLEWIGPSHHLAIVGTVAGHDFEHSAALDHGVEIERIYSEVDGGYVMSGIQVHFPEGTSVDPDGKPWSVAFKNKNFDNHTLPDLYDVHHEEHPEGYVVNMEFDHGGVVPIGDWVGMLSLNHDSGEINADGHHQSGDIGLYLVAENGPDTLMLSVTAPAK